MVLSKNDTLKFIAVSTLVTFSAVVCGCANEGRTDRAGREANPGEGKHAVMAEGSPEGEENMHYGDESDAGHMHSDGDAHHDETMSPGMQEEKLSGVLRNGVRVIEVTARRYAFEPTRIVVNAGEKVRLKVTSTDVTHGIDIEGFDINRKLPPDKTVIIEFTPDQAGRHHFHCSVYCGPGHERMHGELVVIENGS